MYAYAHAPLDEETIILPSYSSGDGLKGLPIFFQKLIDQGFALVYINYILLLAHTKTHMLDLIEQLQQICLSNNLKVAPENSFHILITVKCFGHEIGHNTIRLIFSKVDGIHKLKTPTSKTELMRFIGSMNFYSKFLTNYIFLSKPVHTLLHDDVSFEWTPDLDNLFNEIKLSLSKDAELAIPNTTHSFYITVDASLIGLDALLFQPNYNYASNLLKLSYFNNSRTKTFHI